MYMRRRPLSSWGQRLLTVKGISLSDLPIMLPTSRLSTTTRKEMCMASDSHRRTKRRGRRSLRNGYHCNRRPSKRIQITAGPHLRQLRAALDRKRHRSGQTAFGNVSIVRKQRPVRDRHKDEKFRALDHTVCISPNRGGLRRSRFRSERTYDVCFCPAPGWRIFIRFPIVDPMAKPIGR